MDHTNTLLITHVDNVTVADPTIFGNETNSTILIPFATPERIYIASTICTVVSVCGISANGLVTFVILTHQQVRNQFTVLYASQAGADIGVLLVYLLWTVPMTVTQSSASVEFPGLKLGQISLLFWFAGLYATLSISVNRFLAIGCPVKYNIWFTWKNTLILIGACWLLACLHEIAYVVDGCDFYYDNTSFVWTYSLSLCGQVVEWFLDVGYGVLFFVLVFIFNIATFYKIRNANRIMIKQTPDPNTADCVKKDTSMDRRRDAEIRLFKLACIHSGFFEFMILNFHVFSRLTTNPWGVFVTTTLMWQLAHASNGYILIAFNHDVRVIVKRILCSIFVVCRKKKSAELANLVRGHGGVSAPANMTVLGDKVRRDVNMDAMGEIRRVA